MILENLSTTFPEKDYLHTRAKHGPFCNGSVNPLFPGSFILFIIGDLDVGGTEKHLVRIMPYLKSHGFRVAVYALTHEGYLAPKVRAAGIEVLAPPLSSFVRRFPSVIRPLFSIPLAAIFLWWTIHQQRPDIVHYFLPAAYLLGGVCSFFSKKSIQIMSRRSLNDYQKKYPILKYLEYYLHRRMNAILGNSKAVVVQLLDEGVAPERLGIIYNGVEVLDDEKPKQRMYIRESLNISSGTFVLVMVANLISYKGHRDLLQGIALASEKLHENWIVLCVGRDDGIGSSLKTLAETLQIAEHVRWIGQSDNIPEFLLASDVGILCSHEEGFSNTILENMAAGLPMVVTDVGGNREAVIDGSTGFVVATHSPQAIGEAIVKLAQSPALRQQMGMAGRDRVMNAFALSKCVKEYGQLYHGLLGNPDMPITDILS